MLRIKTHIPRTLNTKIVTISDDYTCEIIYSQVQLQSYLKDTENDSWQAITDNDYYNEIIESRHFLVFRRKNYSEVRKEITEGFPCDDYGSSLFLIQQNNIESGDTFYNCLTRWNNGDDCFARDLTGNTKYVQYLTLKEITGLTDDIFKKIYKIWQKVSINLNKNTIDIPITIKETFSLNLNQEDLYNNQYVKRVEEENINNIIDYEKKQFVLNYITNGTNTNNQDVQKDDYVKKWDDINGLYIMVGDSSGNSEETTPTNRDDVLRIANSLTFNLYFRDREKKTYRENGIDYYDYGEWETDDSKYWVDNDIKTSGKPSKDKKNGDNLYCLGFTDDDVHYQKQNLKKSFLRLSVYDSPLRQTQKLLYYSTLFFDTNVLYKNFIDVLLSSSKNRTEQLVYNASKLTATFTCSNKFKQDAASDGFYLYLFDKVVEGNKFTKLFLKVEFNNAKTGKTVPLLWPGETGYNQSGYDISSNTINGPRGDMKWLKTCPKHYDDGTKTNVANLLNDLYIPIGVKYNYETNEYVWFIICDYRYNICPKNDGNITLNLFEPRINKTE